MALVRSNNPCSFLPSFSPSIFRSQTWYAGVFFLGNQALPLLSSPSLFFRATERSTTLGDEEYLITSRYRIFDSAANVRNEGG